MKKNPLISIIVPVYNKEKYIDDCLKSIINQSYDNIEIVIIDDGSSDNSLNICEAYAKADKRIKVISQANSGPSAARNKGIDIANGEYIAFVDADDMIEKNACEEMLDNILKTGSKVVLVGMCYIYQTGVRELALPNIEKGVISFESYMRLCFRNNIMCFSSVNKMYSKELIGETRFDTTIKMSEDQKFVYEVLKKTDKIAYDPAVYYKINFTDKSLSRSTPTRYHLAQLDVTEYMYNQLKDDETKKICQAYMGYLCLTVFVPYYDTADFTNADIKRVNETINKTNIATMSKGSLTTKIKLILYYISPKLLKFVYLQKVKSDERTV